MNHTLAIPKHNLIFPVVRFIESVIFRVYSIHRSLLELFRLYCLANVKQERMIQAFHQTRCMDNDGRFLSFLSVLSSKCVALKCLLQTGIALVSGNMECAIIKEILL